MKTKLATLLLVGVMTLASCSNEKNDNNVKVSTLDATQKILLDKNYDFKEKTDYELNMVRGEYESLQIIMTPDKDINSYDVLVNEFKNQNGDKLTDIEVFNQKYLDVKNGTVAGANLGLGMYPDALLPFEKAKEYNENKIKANNNQGLWVTFKTNKDTLPGSYTGEIKLTFDGKVKTVTVKVNVLDYYLSEENTAKSVFPIERESLIYGEMDNSREMYKKYVDFLIDYRMAAYLLPAEDKNVKDYVTVATSYAKDPRVPSYAIPVYYEYNGNVADIDLSYDILKDYILEMAKTSINTDVDLISKAYLYIGMIDEPEMGGIIERAKRITSSVTNLKKECSNIILNDTSLDKTKREIYAEKILNIDNLVTNKLTPKLDGYVDSWVPLFDDFDSVNRREEYQSRDESVWWYGCIGPKNPYPTYHLDDVLVSSRILSWMQYDYNIEGNLYWETSLYQKAQKNELTGAFERVPINPYVEASRFPEVNGDGFLTYPGAPYGIDGPVASIRMHSIRDGLEEYELLQDLDEKVDELKQTLNLKSFNNNILNVLYDMLYDGTKVIGNESDFSEARNALLKLIDLTFNTDTLVGNLVYEKDKVNFEVYSKHEVSVSSNKLTKVDTINEFNVYKSSINMTEINNVLNLKVNDKDMLVSLGGKMNVCFDTTNNVGKLQSGKSYVTEIVNNTNLDSKLSEKVTKVTLKPSEKDKVTFKVDISQAKLGDDLDKFVIKVYNPTDKKINVDIFVEGNADPIFKQIYQGNIKSGLNYITVTGMSKFDYDNLGEIKNLHFDIYNRGEEKVIYLDSISYIMKG